MRAEILTGDMRDILAGLEADRFHACVTDPPYGLGFMGAAWDREVLRPAYWREVLRVLRPGAHLAAFAGTRTWHRMAVAIEDAGFEIRDTLMWVYGQGLPKSLDVGKATASTEWNGWGTNLKPAWEPIILARKSLSERSVAENVLRWGTGAINVNACRIPIVGRKGYWPGKAHVPSLGVTGFGRGTNPENEGGRWPANLAHDGSQMVLDLFSDTGDGYGVCGEAFSRNCYGGGQIGARPTSDQVVGHGDGGSAARFFYCAKASPSDRDDGLARLPGAAGGGRSEAAAESRGEGSRWPAKNPHPTVKPTALMAWLCRLLTPPGGEILDPFAGSGSTGRGAVLEGFGFVGIEIDPDYASIARFRIQAAAERAAKSQKATKRPSGPEEAA